MSDKQSVEVEAKFIVPDKATLQRLLKARELGGFRLEPAPTRQVSDSYRDTADRAIYRGGYACRIRRKGERRIAALKGLGETKGAIHKRAEYEVTLGTGESPADWPASPARDLALALSCGAPLTKLFSISQQRYTRIARAGDRRVAELSLDVVNMRTTDGIETTFEIEAELLPAGALDDLALMAAALQNEWQLQPQAYSKFERGLAALSAKDDSPEKSGANHRDTEVTEKI